MNNLGDFLKTTHNHGTKKDDTETLANMIQSFQKKYRLYFLSGGGSNQHDQLLLNRAQIPSLVVADDAPERTEIAVPTRLGNPREESSRAKSGDVPQAIFAGGGHSGLLTDDGRLFLWGWNQDLQCGTESVATPGECDEEPLSFVEPLRDIVVETASFGFSHTLVIEKQTGKVFAFGNDERGQISGRQNVPLSDIATPPLTPHFLEDEEVVMVNAGLYHSAVVTKSGELITFGCDRFGQSNLSNGNENPIVPSDDTSNTAHWRWKPSDADRIVEVACGRRHTVAVDSLNRIWTFGENRHGQLGRKTEKKKRCTPSAVNMEGKIREDDTVRVYCGWSHTIIHVKGVEGSKFYGFGRNDKGEI